MSSRATRYIENLKKNNAARAKEERDAFLIEHHFTETVIDENGKEKIVPETVTDEEYEILRKALYVDPDFKAKEAKASAGWFPILIGGLTVIGGAALFFYCSSYVSAAIAWGVLISCVVLASVLFALGEIVNGIRQIELTSNINEKTLKEILRYVKSSHKSSNASKECKPIENGNDEPTVNEKPNPLAEEEGHCVPCSNAENQKEENRQSTQPEEKTDSKKISSTDQAVIYVVCVAAVLIAICIALRFLL